MQISFEILKMLRHTGAPMELNITENHQPTHSSITISRKDGGQVQVTGEKLEDAVRTLKNSLVHYPAQVRINSEPLETKAFTNMAQATLITYLRNSQEAYSSNPIPTGQSARVHGNALVGGVLCRVQEPVKTTELNYYSVDESSTCHHGAHWKKLAKVNLIGVMVIKDEDVDKLTWSANRTPEIPRGSDLSTRVAIQLRDQFQRTMKIPGVPAEHQGPVFHKVISLYQEHPFLTGVPIAVTTGTPVQIAESKWVNNEYYNAAQAFYHAGSALVPVHFMNGQDFNEHVPHNVVETFEFSVTDLNGKSEPILDHQSMDNPKHARYVDSVSMSYTLRDEHGQTQTGQVRSPFYLGGEVWNNRNITISRHSTDPEDTISEHLAQAYWEYFDEYTRDEVYDEWEMICIRARNEAIALRNPQGALINEVTDWLRRFTTDYPSPKNELKINSPDGRMTVIIHPPGTEPQLQTPK